MDRPTDVLIVDDDREIVIGVRTRLMAAGYRVRTAHDGRQAISEALRQRPDVILLDIRMPNWDGFETLGALRKCAEMKSVPVIMLSANIGDHTSQQAFDLGASFVIEKPYDVKALLLAIGAVTSPQ
jgi:DNA-binding response OmpR family regulator